MPVRLRAGTLMQGACRGHGLHACRLVPEGLAVVAIGGEAWHSRAAALVPLDGPYVALGKQAAAPVPERRNPQARPCKRALGIVPARLRRGPGAGERF